MRSALYTVAQIIGRDDINVPTAQAGEGQVRLVLQLVFGVAGAAALLIITLAGLKYVLSRGNPDAITKAKDTIIYALVGLVVTMTAFAIVTFVVNNV